ncbi:MAG: DUF805 domain-containing protein [Cyanobium sp.]
MNPLIDAFSAAWRRSFDESGRCNRGDDCWFVLANAIISAVLLVLSNIANLFSWLDSIGAVATLVPSLSLPVRRLRDASAEAGPGASSV